MHAQEFIEQTGVEPNPDLILEWLRVHLNQKDLERFAFCPVHLPEHSQRVILSLLQRPARLLQVMDEEERIIASDSVEAAFHQDEGEGRSPRERLLTAVLDVLVHQPGTIYLDRSFAEGGLAAQELDREALMAWRSMLAWAGWSPGPEARRSVHNEYPSLPAAALTLLLDDPDEGSLVRVLRLLERCNPQLDKVPFEDALKLVSVSCVRAWRALLAPLESDPAIEARARQLWSYVQQLL